MSNRVKSARGKIVDMAALAAKNETTRAVGNIPMNARGDRINPDGSVKVKAEDIARIAKNHKNESKQVALSDPKPVRRVKTPETSPSPKVVAKSTKTRDDGTKYIEVEYDDGSIETKEEK
jgi:hypothetical protein